MVVFISNSLKLIIDVMKENCTKKELVNRFEFKELLKTLNSTEKCMLAKVFCQTEWNIGSLRVLSVLQELRILTAKEFIISLDNRDEFIINDFLEAEFSLLANLLVSANYDAAFGDKLNIILDECFQSFFNDLLKNQEVNDLSYLKALKSQLPEDVLRKLTMKHVYTVLQLHRSSIKGAFQKFSTWINEGVDELNFIKQFYEALLVDREIEVLNYLFKLSTNEHFKSWKFYLILLQTIVSKCGHETTKHIKKYLKTRIREIAALPNKEHMVQLLLTARAATATTTDVQKNITAYADWYRENIAEMKFLFKTEEFRNICELLEQCISFEMEQDYLEIHAIISISPPVLCGKLVQNYKSQCKFRLTQIKLKNDDCMTAAAEQTIVIDSE